MRSFTTILVLSLTINFLSLSAQQQKTDQIIENAYQERDNNTFTIRFIDALSGDPVSDAILIIENIGTFASDTEGRVTFSRQPNGVLKAVFKKSGYISALLNIDIVAETILHKRYIVSPVMDIDQFRVVLTWEQQPEDLDAHFVKANSYHISYRNSRILNDGTGQLDRDDMDGFGPETITVSQLNANKDYTFFVYNYSTKINSSAPPISISKATVWVYGNGKLLNIFYAPTNLKGDTWQVFKVIQGNVVPL